MKSAAFLAKDLKNRMLPSYFLSMFQKNGTGETNTPDKFDRHAIGWNHWPKFT
jgi:hypothetical protein